MVDMQGRMPIADPAGVCPPGGVAGAVGAGGVDRGHEQAGSGDQGGAAPAQARLPHRAPQGGHARVSNAALVVRE